MTKQKDPYFNLINDLIEADKDNMETARELAEMGFEVNCTECGDPKCLGTYAHYTQYEI